MNPVDRWVVLGCSALCVGYTGSTLGFAAQESIHPKVVAILGLNTVQVVWYVLIILEVVYNFSYKIGLGDERYLGLTIICSVFVAHLAVPLQYQVLFDCIESPSFSFKMKICLFLIFVLNVIQLSIFLVSLFCFFHRLFISETKDDTDIHKLARTKWYRSRQLHQQRLLSLYPSKTGLRYLVDVYLPSLHPLFPGELYCEPIVMAYIFAVCTWVIPADDTVWIRETCEICSSAYKKFETILVNHEGQHLHEYCARRWFPSLRARGIPTLHASANLTDLMFGVQGFGRWIDQLQGLSPIRGGDDSLPKPSKREQPAAQN